MFSGFVNQSVMFVLMGNFTSKPVQGAVDVARVKGNVHPPFLRFF